MRRHALALWFAGLGSLGALRGWMAWREVPAGGALKPHELLWWVGAALCIALALWAWWSGRRDAQPARD